MIYEQTLHTELAPASIGAPLRKKYHQKSSFTMPTEYSSFHSITTLTHAAYLHKILVSPKI